METPGKADPAGMLKLHLISLGCPKNLVDSEWILGELVGSGVELVGEPRQADVILINTCGFIGDAKKESVETILEAVQLKKMGYCQQVLVTGCLVERYREELLAEIPEIDRVWGARNTEQIPHEIAGFLHLPGQAKAGLRRFLTTRSGYAYLKIAEGCDNLCSFCAIPAIRGRHVSRPPQEILREAAGLAQQGVKELIVISQDTTYYGRDLADGWNLPRLLRELEKISGIEWIRVLYLYPERITEELLDVMANSEKICPYLDIPIQHISDRILRSMRRGSRRATVERLIERIRAKIPEAAIRTTMIVGYPGETDAEFEELLDFVEQAQFDRLGAFRFSPEEGTPAAELPDQVPEPVKEQRFEALMALQQEIALRKNQRLVGRKLTVIVDGEDGTPGLVRARTRWDAPEIDQKVVVPAGAAPGELLEVRITGALHYELKGEIVRA